MFQLYVIKEVHTTITTTAQMNNIFGISFRMIFCSVFFYVPLDE